ncbi:MAG: tyrosine-type recombinase/integrase [Faecalibacterium prausnitzii]
MKKNISRNPLWPDWYNGKKIDEVQFGRAFLEQWPLKCVNGTLYTLDGPVEDESEIKQRILENIEEYVTSGLSKKVTNILETIKLLAFSDPFPIEQDCIHLQNGVYHLPDGSFQESRLFCQNRLPVKYAPKAPAPDRWLTFLHELLDDADIPTLQEYLGYCLIPSTKGQKMMLIVGKGGEGKSRIGLVLKRLMGDAASNGSVQKVENNRFARADLERRLLMIDDDMDKLRPYHIEALYDTLSKTPCGQYVGGKRRDLSPKQQKRTLSGTTLHEVHQLLHNSFLLAVEPVLIRKKFLKWQDAHPELPHIVFHELRHSSAPYQLIISGGDVKAVQGTTGHASADMLVNTYAHIQQSSRVELGKKFESGFYAKPDTPSPQAVPATGEPTISMTALLELLKDADPEMKAKLRLALLT